jgi:hypothetical protein
VKTHKNALQQPYYYNKNVLISEQYLLTIVSTVHSQMIKILLNSLSLSLSLPVYIFCFSHIAHSLRSSPL